MNLRWADRAGDGRDRRPRPGDRARARARAARRHAHRPARRRARAARRGVGGRAIASDLADRDALERLLAEAGPVDVLVANAGLPGQRPARLVHASRRSTARWTSTCARRCCSRGCSPTAWSSAAAATCCSCRRSPARPARRGARSTRRRSSACAASRSACARTCAPRGVGVSSIFPGFIRDAGMFADSGAKLPAYVGTKPPEDVARAVVEGDRAATAPSSTSRRCRCARDALAGLAPDRRRVQRRLGAPDRHAVRASQRDKR